MYYNDYNRPTMDLLNDSEPVTVNEENQIKTLQQILDDFKIKAKVTGFIKGARIIQYELKLERGVSIAKVKKVIDDIALWLGVESVRLIPIPENNSVGLEVPNKSVETVGLKNIINTPKFDDSTSNVTIGIGKTITGEPIISDIAEMPHLLIAGATGSGKSVFINTLITSILYKATPDEVKFIMIDPKMVELSGYNGIPHLLAPVITADSGKYKKASTALKWVVREMTKRYDLMALAGVRKFDEYNAAATDKFPRIVVIIDELADLMLSALKDRIENSINRIAAMGRAAGIHLVVATQRPDAKIVTGLIKANIPTRVAFMVSTAINSRIILDENGAEGLLGKGDMLIHKSDGSKAIRAQSAFVSNEEIEKIIEYVKSNNSKVEYNDKLMEEITDAGIPVLPQGWGNR